MPTVLRWGPYRFFFYSNEGSEPAHIHVERDRSHAKFWLDEVRPARPSGFGDRELRRLAALVVEHRARFREAWDEHFEPRG